MADELAEAEHFRWAMRALRERAGLSQAKVGAALGMSASHVSLIERGRRETYLNVWRQYARACGARLHVDIEIGDEPEEEQA